MSWFLWLLIIPGGLFLWATLAFLCYILCMKMEAIMEDWKTEYTWKTEIKNGDTGILWTFMLFWYLLTPVMVIGFIGHYINKLFIKIAEVSDK